MQSLVHARAFPRECTVDDRTIQRARVGVARERLDVREPRAASRRRVVAVASTRRRGRVAPSHSFVAVGHTC